ncbi:MAG: hypothetical protein DCC58_20505 [Chloroflexi bacterium]|nr:MAG: hypothetical protein DCC58_20505 [Chloroflexota bacterium]
MSNDPEVKRHVEKLEALQREEDVQGVVDALGELLKTVSRTFRPTDLAHSLQSLRGTVSVLKGDTDRCLVRYELAFRDWLSDTRDQEKHKLLQFELRQLIRTFFAEVEGTMYSARQVILWAHERGEVGLSVPEQALLREESYRFDSKAKAAVAKPAFGNALDSLLLTFTVIPRVFGSQSSLDLSRFGWQAFRELLEVRNAVTHPKELINLVVNAEVVTKKLPAARKWYYGSLVAAVDDAELRDLLRGVG